MKYTIISEGHEKLGMKYMPETDELQMKRSKDYISASTVAYLLWQAYQHHNKWVFTKEVANERRI